MRIALFAIMLAASVLPARAAEPGKPESQFLDSSVVTIPKVSGVYRLADTKFDDATWQLGITTRWTLPDTPPGLTFTLFIYPMGDGPEADVAKSQIEDVAAAIRLRGEQGDYETVRVGARKPFEVVARKGTLGDKEDKPFGDAAFDPMPKPEAVLTPKKGGDPILSMIATSMPPANNSGFRQTFQYKTGGVETRSLGYAFYRHLFAFKVRVSVAAAEMDQASFEAASDAAVRWLVPQVDVANFGTCATVYVNTETKDKNAGIAALLAGVGRVQRNNCSGSGSLGPKAPATESERRTIVYPAGTWKSD
jgi:hypothetical protein